MPLFDIIAFDADDTLWHNERLYIQAQEKLVQLLSHYHPPEWINERMYQTEMRNLQHFGYGIKAFALSMIETAVELTEGRINGSDIQTLVDEARGMLAAELELLPHATETLSQLAKTYPLMAITKGDPIEQEPKFRHTGLESYFQSIEVVRDKTRERYEQLFKRYTIASQRFLMVGNSLRSDILPVLELGATAIYVPYPSTWEHENSDPPPAGQNGFYQIEHLGQLPALLQQIESAND